MTKGQLAAAVTNLDNVRSLKEDLSWKVLKDDITKKLACTGQHGYILALKRSEIEDESLDKQVQSLRNVTLPSPM